MATQVKPKCFQGVKDTFKQEQLKEPKKAILGEAYFWAILIGARFCIIPSCDRCFTGCRTIIVLFYDTLQDQVYISVGLCKKKSNPSQDALKMFRDSSISLLNRFLNI